MSTVKVATSKLTALASAVRSKSGESEGLTLNDIPNIIPSLAAPPTWADGTWEQIAQALSDHKSGKIDLYTIPGWEIGATRIVPLSAMASTGVGESHVAQDVEIVLTDKDVYDLSDGSGKCVFTWDLKDCLANGSTLEGGYLNYNNSNSKGWDGSSRRGWCNDVFYNALPTLLKNLIPQVNVKAAKSRYDSTIITSTDYCFLRSEIEVIGEDDYSHPGEGTQIAYYETDTNRIKKAGKNGGNCLWWWRSPIRTNSNSYGCCGSDGKNYTKIANHTDGGIAPCGCL